MLRTFPPTAHWFAEVAQGYVEETITPTQVGRIRFRGSFWKAELADCTCRLVKPGELVQVVGRQGITLLVVPE
jgi:membrane protein implicated in regulation of membrane protease activity